MVENFGNKTAEQVYNNTVSTRLYFRRLLEFDQNDQDALDKAVEIYDRIKYTCFSVSNHPVSDLFIMVESTTDFAKTFKIDKDKMILPVTIEVYFGVVNTVLPILKDVFGDDLPIVDTWQAGGKDIDYRWYNKNYDKMEKILRSVALPTYANDIVDTLGEIINDDQLFDKSYAKKEILRQSKYLRNRHSVYR